MAEPAGAGPLGASGRLFPRASLPIQSHVVRVASGRRTKGAGVPPEGSLEEEEGLGEAAENSRTRPGRLMRPPPGRPLGLMEAWAPGRTQPGPVGPHMPAPRAPTAGRAGRG